MNQEREEPCAAPPLPKELSAALRGYAWVRNTVGESGADIYRLRGKPGAQDLFLKSGRGDVADDLVAEFGRLRWLARHLPVPAVTHFVSSADAAWLVMTALPGETAYQALIARPESAAVVVGALAAFLRRFHAIPTSACPFNSDHLHRLRLARARIDAGLVDEADFDAARQGWTAGQVWDAMQALLPLAPDPVVTHGDFSLDNILVQDGAVVGCIDAGRVGVANRYQDLAILWNCLGEFGGDLQDQFLGQYGIACPDRRKLDFHLLLDELF